MDIKYLGHASFFIKSKDARLVTDPYDTSIGIKFPKVEADIVTVSHHHRDHDNSKAVEGNPLIIDMPGEFEKNGIRIFGYLGYHDKEKGAKRGENILYKIEAEGISVLHCGDLGVVLDDTFIDMIGDVDVLLVPVGGFYTIDPQEAVELVKKIEPSIVIPMHYNQPKLNQEIFSKLSGVDEFLDKKGASAVVPTPKLTLKKETLVGDEMKVVVMEIQS